MTTGGWGGRLKGEIIEGKAPLDTVAAMVRAGFTVSRIAADLGVNRRTVMLRVKMLGGRWAIRNQSGVSP